MFGEWRLTLRQAEEAARSERFEEALELARRPEVADHRRAGQLRHRIALRLAARAGEQLRLGHSQAAWRDLHQAEQAGAPAPRLAGVRRELIERALAEMGRYIAAGDPAQALERADDVLGRGEDSTELRRLRQGAACWQEARRIARDGDFRRALEQMSVARELLGATSAADRQLAEMRENQSLAAERGERLAAAVARQDWAVTLRAAEAILELAPRCRAALQARDEAWRRLGVPLRAAAASVVPVRRDAPARIDPYPRNGSLAGRFVLWVDGVGGYLVLPAPRVTIGQAAPDGTADIPVFGDLSRQHATIVRDGEGYTLCSERSTWVNERPVGEVPLRDGDRVRLGRSVELVFRQPCPVSATARLELSGPHRLHLAVAGVLLVADTCVLAGGDQAHVRVPDLRGQVVLYRQGGEWWCRADGPIEVDGCPFDRRAPLRPASRVIAGELSFSLEPLGTQLGPA